MSAEGEAPRTEAAVTAMIDRFVVQRAHRLIYAPVFKAGNTSVKRLLLALDRPEAAEPMKSGAYKLSKIHSPVESGLEYLSALSSAEKAALLTDERYLRFTVVRCPWRRLLSAWMDKLVPILDDLKGRGDARKVAARADFRDYLEQILERSRAAGGKATVADVGFADFVAMVASGDALTHDPHWKPQWLCTAVDRVRFHRVVHFEDLRPFLEEMVERFGLPERLASERANRTEADRVFAAHYTGDLIEAVGRYYARDVEAFGFERPVVETDASAPGTVGS